jgi:peptide-methionine (S)-S-oxide reductase
MKTEKAILAGGCFWGLQDLIRKYPGVLETRVVYTGGEVVHATYENHGSHAECLEIVFDPLKLSFRKLLEFFFQIHDPTTLNRQGNDFGEAYRSAIFYLNDGQKEEGEKLIAEMGQSKKWPGLVKTEVVAFKDFWLAEAYHQDYLLKHPGGYTCHWHRSDWKLSVPTKAQIS